MNWSAIILFTILGCIGVVAKMLGLAEDNWLTVSIPFILITAAFLIHGVQKLLRIK